MKTMLSAIVLAAATSLAMADNINPDVIFGSGNANGSFTVDTSSNGNVELGLRAKVRYDANGQPQNTFNYDGVNSYTFNPTNANTPSGRATWNFEWSINTDVNDSTGNNLNDFTYEMAMFKLDADGTDNADAVVGDIINTPWADHAIGDNGTGNGNGTSAPFLDTVTYGNLIDNNNVAQNSWNYGFFDGNPDALQTVDFDAAGTYIIRLRAFDMSGAEIAGTTIYVTVVPLPTAAWAGLGMLGLFGGVRVVRRR